MAGGVQARPGLIRRSMLAPGTKPALRTLLGWLAGLAAIVWVLWGLDWGELAGALGSISYGWLLAAVGSFLVSLLLKLVRWRGLLAGTGPRPSWLTLARAMFIGQAVNIVGVGRFGEVARVVWLLRALTVQGSTGSDSRAGTAAAGLATSVIAEKVLDLIFLGLAGVWWLAIVLTPGGENQIWLLLAAGLAGLAALLALGLFGQPLFNRLQEALARRPGGAWSWLNDQLAAFSLGMASLARRHILGYNFGLTGLIWAVMMLTNAALLQAFHLPATLNLALAVVVWAHIGVAGNLTPANIGPHEWAITFGLSLMNVPRSPALAFALVLHSIVTLLPLILTLILNGWSWPSIQAAGSPLAPE